MEKLKKYLMIVLIAFPLCCAEAYVTSKTKNGTQIRWATNSNQVNLYFNAANSNGADENILQTIAAHSAGEWDFLSSININKGSTLGSGQEGLNEIYFSNDPNIFSGSSLVAGLTQVSYREDDGLILEADILINQNNSIGTNINGFNYIGNILTHEMGHFLGLDHSQTIGSTMFWALSLGQNKIAGDDKAGLYSIYPTSSSNLKSISGKIVGGKNLIGIFGASVEAISSMTGQIMGATLSDLNGNFTIAGLPTNDKYFIYTKPSLVSRLSSKYSSVQTNFCDGGADFRGSFFQGCGGGNVGYPQAISLLSADVNVGNVTIRCSLDVPPEYIQKKTNGETDFSVIQTTVNGIGNAFVGFFSNQEVASGLSSDTFKIDLTGVNTTTWNSLDSGSLYLEIQVQTQNYYSPFKANVSVVNNGVTTTPAKYIREADGWVNIDTLVRIPIDKITTANNFFEISITPQAINSISAPVGLPTTISYILPDYSEFADNLYFYLVNTHIVKLNNDGTYSNVSSKSYVPIDNTSCPDANNTYQLSNYATGTDSSTSRRNTPSGCGTVVFVDENNSKGSGPTGLAIGFFITTLVFYLLKFKRRLKQSYFI